MYEVKTRKKFTIFFPGVAFKIERFACYASCFDFLGEVIMDRFTQKLKLLATLKRLTKKIQKQKCAKKLLKIYL